MVDVRIRDPYVGALLPRHISDWDFSSLRGALRTTAFVSTAHPGERGGPAVGEAHQV